MTSSRKEVNPIIALMSMIDVLANKYNIPREALVEFMGSEVPSTLPFSEGCSPKENSTMEVTKGL